MWAQRHIGPQDRYSIIRDARDYALLHGLVLRSTQLTNDNCVAHVPFTLFPSPFPTTLYQECLDIQPTINSLMCKIANDSDYLEQTLRPIAQVDEFTKNLLDINSTVLKEGRATTIISCISRADYMLDQYRDKSLRARQVEVNAIASSMSAHSHNVKHLHKYLNSKYNIHLPSGTSIPENNSLELVAMGIIDAFDVYSNPSAHVLLVNEKRSFNFSDQQLIELKVNQIRPDIKIIRRRFVDLPQIVRLGPNKELILDDSKEIALVYYRFGYDPSHYDFPGSWDLRLLLERSRAIKCPSINFHLSGAKKFQQILNSPRQLERYLDTTSAKRLAKVFCKFWPLDSEDFQSSEQYRLIEKDSHRLVLKPQREGGGHNIFGQQIKPFVDSIQDPAGRSQYILMEYIESPREHNWLLLPNDTNDDVRLDTSDKLISELGIFGSTLSDGSLEISNKSAGYLVRSKRSGENEGGVAMGYAGISNIFLVDDCDMSACYELFYDKS